MKFTLIIWVCTFISNNTCMTPIESTNLYNSWYECARAAHTESKKIYSKLGYRYVNENKIATRYTCTNTSST